MSDILRIVYSDNDGEIHEIDVYDQHDMDPYELLFHNLYDYEYDALNQIIECRYVFNASGNFDNWC